MLSVNFGVNSVALGSNFLGFVSSSLKVRLLCCVARRFNFAAVVCSSLKFVLGWVHRVLSLSICAVMDLWEANLISGIHWQKCEQVAHLWHSLWVVIYGCLLPQASTGNRSVLLPHVSFGQRPLLTLFFSLLALTAGWLCFDFGLFPFYFCHLYGCHDLAFGLRSYRSGMTRKSPITAN